MVLMLHKLYINLLQLEGLKAFKFIKVVSDTVLDMINVFSNDKPLHVYDAKPLMFIN